MQRRKERRKTAQQALQLQVVARSSSTDTAATLPHPTPATDTASSSSSASAAAVTEKPPLNAQPSLFSTPITKPSGPVHCAVCEEETAVWWCAACTMACCVSCDADIHRPKARAAHSRESLTSDTEKENTKDQVLDSGARNKKEETTGTEQQTVTIGRYQETREGTTEQVQSDNHTQQEETAHVTVSSVSVSSETSASWSFSSSSSSSASAHASSFLSPLRVRVDGSSSLLPAPPLSPAIDDPPLFDVFSTEAQEVCPMLVWAQEIHSG